MADESDFDQLPLPTWTPDGGDTCPIPVQRWEAMIGNRLVAHQRIYRDGARHDDTGNVVSTWRANCHGFKDSDEDGIDADYFPNGIAALVASFAVHATGTLITPEGPRRCRAEKMTRIYDRKEGGTDAVLFVLEFVEDNEDDVTAASFDPPKFRTAANDMLRLVGDTTDSNGAIAGDFFDAIKEASADLVALANYPGDVTGEIVTRIEIIDDSINQVGQAYASAPANSVAPMNALLTDPFAGPALRALDTFLDTAKRAVDDQIRSASARVTRTYNREVSIFDVSVDVSQSADDLMAMNKGLPDFYSIPPNTPIFVLADAA